MGAATTSVDWPSLHIAEPAKKLIDLFYTLADGRIPDTGDRLADEVFASDGILQNNDLQIVGLACKTEPSFTVE